MERKSPVWLVCLLGGIIGGALVFAGNLQYHYSLWLTFPIGIVVGILTAYLGYDWNGVKQGMMEARHESKIHKWRPKWDWWGTLMSVFFYRFVQWFTLGLIIEVLCHHLGFDIIKSSGIFKWSLWDSVLYSAIKTAYFTAGWFTILFGLPKPKSPELLEMKNTTLWYINPFALPFWTLRILWEILVMLVKGTWNCFLKIPTVGRELWGSIVDFTCECGRFFKNTFLFIHTQGRLIVMIDTALGIIFGVALGLYLNNPLLGTIACGVIGAILGEVNYQIVSIRWLKVKPV